MKKTITLFSLLLLLVTAGSLSAQLRDRADYIKTCEAKKALTIARLDTSHYASYVVTAARYASGNGVDIADSLMLELNKNLSGDMFWMFPHIGSYIMGKAVMADTVKRAARNAWKTYAPSRGDTENHWAMYYSTLFLATEQWPNLPGSEWFNGKSSAENQAEAKEYLFSWAKLTTTKGQGEFDSPDYLIEYMIATTYLAGWAQDPELKQLGKMLSDYFMADFAIEHLNGQYGGGHSRIYENKLMAPDRSVASELAAQFFDCGEPHIGYWIINVLNTGYVLPEIIYEIANDRSKTYVERERKRVRHNIRFGTEKNPPVYKYSYVNKDYILGSLHGDLLQPIQQQTWEVCFDSGKPFPMIFGLHPYWSAKEIGTFFPGILKTCMAGIVSSKKSYNKPDKWTGGSYYERTFQNQNTLMVLYDIPVDVNSNHIDGFFPANLDERIVDDSGWIFCRAGDVYVGWYPLQAGEWSPEYKVERPAFAALTGSRDNDGTQTLRNYRFRSWELQNGYVIEVRSKDEIGSFAKFTRKLRRRIPTAHLVADAVSVSYKSLDGDKMEFAFPDKRILNGTEIDLSTTPQFESPYLNAAQESEMLTITYKGKTRIYDFKNLTITDK